MLSNETTRLSSSKWLNEMRLSYKYIIGTTIITLRKKGISVKHVNYFLCWRCLLLYVYLLTNISLKTTSLYILRTSSSRVVFIYTTRRQSSFEEHVYTVRTTFVSLYSYANKKKKLFGQWYGLLFLLLVIVIDDEMNSLLYDV